jgi:RHS repeat-associated protein
LAAIENFSSATSFRYDDNGLRVIKTENGETIWYVNDYFEINLTSGEETSNYYFGGNLVAINNDGVLQYVLQDHLGSTTQITDSDGEVSGSAGYLPFGASNYDDILAAQKFTGQRLDGSGLYYYNARYYDPDLGRFISPDTIVQDPTNPQDLNRYTYCLNNPLKYTDPSGHIFWIPILIAVGIGALSGGAFYTGEVLLSNAIQGQSLLNDWSWSEFGWSVGISGATAGILKIPAVGRLASRAANAIGRFLSPLESEAGFARLVGRSGKYDVGIYDEIRGVPGLDAHHVGQKALMKNFIPEYDANTAPAILVPPGGHVWSVNPGGIVSRSIVGIKNARQLIARDIMELRRLYPDIPNSQLQKLIELNKRLYPIIRSK